MNSQFTRRRFLKLAGLAGAGTILASCAPAATPTPAAAQASGPTAESPKKFKVDHLTIPIWWGPHDIEAVQGLFDTRFTPDTGLTVKFEYIGSSDYVPTVFTRLSGNDPYDLVAYNADTASQFVAKGALLPLDDLIKKNGVDLSDFDPAALEQWTHDGKLYGLSNDLGTFHAYFNVDLFKKAGLEVPKPTETWTWDKLLEYARALTVKEGDQIVQYGVSSNAVTWAWDIFANLNGAHIWDEKLSKSTLDDPKVIEAFQFFQDLMYKEQVALLPGASKLGPHELFAAGQLAILLDGTWITGFLRDKMSEIKFTWDVGLLPTNATPAFIPNFTAGWSIPSVAKDPDASFAALQLYASETFNEVMTNFAVVPVRFSATKKAYFYQWPERPPEGLTSEFYAKLKELGVSRRHLKFDLGSDIVASLAKLDLIWSNERQPADVLPEIASEINQVLPTRPWNK